MGIGVPNGRHNAVACPELFGICREQGPMGQAN